MDLQMGRLQLLVFMVGIIALSLAAEKCRLLVGEESSSQSGKFTIFDCLDMSTGTLACTVKEGVKLYVYNVRSSHVERARNMAIEQAINDGMQQGTPAKQVAKQAQKEGAKAAKLATKKAKRIVGPIISSGWDFFEAVYYGGTVTEGFLRGAGTLFGTYGGGFFGERSIGRFGYVVGSQLGSWVGGRIGLMVYDVANGVNYLLLNLSEAIGDESEKEGNVWEGAAEDASNDYEATAGYEGSSESEALGSDASSDYESPTAAAYESSESEALESSSTLW